MPVNPNAQIEITGLEWVPEFVRGFVRDFRVRWALEEAGLDYRVRLLPRERSASYLKEHPFDQVPCFSDGKVQMFESGAIVQYIGDTCETLLPGEAGPRWRAIQWMYAALNSLEPPVQHRALLDLFYADQEWAKLRKPGADEFARHKLKRVSDWLGDKAWLEGDRFTAGDLIMVTVLRVARSVSLLDPTPNLQAYVDRGEARPAFQRALDDHMASFIEPQLEGAGV